MKKLLVYLKDYKKESVLAPLFKMLEASFELIVPLIVSAIIDRGIATADKGYVIRMCLCLVGLGLVGLFSSVTAQYFSAKAAVGFATKLRHSLFQKMHSLSFAEIDKVGTSTMITRMTSDVNQVQSGVNLTLRLFLRSPFIVFGALVMALALDLISATVFMVAIPVLCVIVFGIMLVTIPLYKKAQANLDGVVLSTRENLTGVRVIRAFCREEDEKTDFSVRNQKLYKSQKFVGGISALMNPLTYAVINAATIVLIWIGALRVDAGILTQGKVVALYNYMSQILVELIKMANLIVTLTKAVASGNRLEGILDMTSSLRQTGSMTVHPEFQSKRIVFDHVSLRYHGAGANSLTDITFSAAPGETVGVIGGTGSGKTSLVHLIPHFYDATDGAVYVDGINVADFDTETLRQKVGIVMQKAVLFQGSIRENLLWGKGDATDEELTAAVETAQASDVLQAKGGLSAQIEQGGKNLSGGQRQRLSIARALVKRPEILILDDSASALDYATDAKLRKALLRLDYQPTVLIVSQRTSSLRHADKILVLEDGVAVGMGKHEELLQTCPVYREIHESQNKSGEAQA